MALRCMITHWKTPSNAILQDSAKNSGFQSFQCYTRKSVNRLKFLQKHWGTNTDKKFLILTFHEFTQSKFVCKFWRVSATTRYHFSFGGRPLIELSGDNTKMITKIFVTFGPFCWTIIKGEDGLILQIFEKLKVVQRIYTNWLNDVFQRQVNLQLGQKQKGLAQSGYYLHISKFGGNLQVNKSSFVKIVYM